MSNKPTAEAITNGPSAPAPAHEPTDAVLVSFAVQGDHTALAALVRRHQGFVYSLAHRMLFSPEDAADATQEILVRIITKLDSFRGEAAFRTWAYRIAVRHLLAMSKGRVEQRVHDFSCFGRTLDATPDLDPPDAGSLPVDVKLVIEEAKVGCLMAMLLCLDREHRMAFVLGEIFEVSDTVAAEVLGISCANARQRLFRARQQLRHFLTGRCGLLDERGSCRCARKTRGFIQQGIVDPARLRFSPIHLDRARKASTEGVRVLQGCVEQAYAELLRGQPLTESVDFAAILRTVLEQGDVRRALDLEN